MSTVIEFAKLSELSLLLILLLKLVVYSAGSGL